MHALEREACAAAARAGAAALLPHFRRLDPSTVAEKTRHDFVTAADRASEAAIHRELRERFPQDAVLAEESGASGQGLRTWIVDPLDGTLNFLQGFPHWSVSVALWDAQGPLVGCVLDPLREDCFLAVRGEGATWNGRPMAVSRHPALEGAFLATGFAFQLGDRFPFYNQALGRIFPQAKGIRRAGSAALDLAHTAAGIYDGFFELGLQRWDLAAGVLLVQEAGGEITDWKGAETWRVSGDLLAGAPGVRQGLADAIGAL